MKTIQMSNAIQREIAKWNEANKVSKLLGIDETGTSKVITPANLLTVQRKRNVPGNDFNNALNEGAYTIADPNKKWIDNPGIEYGVLCVANSDDFVVQYAFDLLGTRRLFFRIRNERGTWQTWVSFSPSA
ncbi:hypothetical protein [Bacteroides caecimuris]|uniref:hypothetical protein n=1 Tax=Bacteroides caecimuris TaxID=1796613 RepID=UPI001C3DEFBC|nr:hypothetical protein [Bacteroides caecimuris]